jgi:hypothetical protein
LQNSYKLSGGALEPAKVLYSRNNITYIVGKPYQMDIVIAAIKHDFSDKKSFKFNTVVEKSVVEKYNAVVEISPVSGIDKTFFCIEPKKDPLPNSSSSTSYYLKYVPETETETKLRYELRQATYGIYRTSPITKQQFTIKKGEQYYYDLKEDKVVFAPNGSYYPPLNYDGTISIDVNETYTIIK